MPSSGPNHRQQMIAAVTLVVPDYDQAIAFYVGRLGFRLLTDIPQPGPKRWVTVAPPGSAAGTALLLAEAKGTDQLAVIGNQAAGRVFLILETDDFDRDHGAMIAVGVTFEEAPRSEPYGRVAVWQDPFGNRWDLIQRA